MNYNKITVKKFKSDVRGYRWKTVLLKNKTPEKVLRFSIEVDQWNQLLNRFW